VSTGETTPLSLICLNRWALFICAKVIPSPSDTYYKRKYTEALMKLKTLTVIALALSSIRCGAINATAEIPASILISSSTATRTTVDTVRDVIVDGVIVEADALNESLDELNIRLENTELMMEYLAAVDTEQDTELDDRLADAITDTLAGN
jgi:hypothetical protein